MTREPKRIKRWVNTYTHDTGYGHASANVARQWADKGATRVAVPLIELRRGEVVVDVEALAVKIAWDVATGDFEDSRHLSNRILAVIKKAGVR